MIEPRPRDVATATVTELSKVGGDTGSAAVSFSGAAVTEFNACVTVTDDKYGPLGKVCAADVLPHVFKYTMVLGPYEVCGKYTFVNTAKLTVDDSQQSQESSWTVNVDVPCEVGCTLTPHMEIRR